MRQYRSARRVSVFLDNRGIPISLKFKRIGITRQKHMQVVCCEDAVMVKPVKNTKFDEYLEFPCPFTFKIMGLANVNLTDQILAKLQVIAPGDYAPKVKPSSKGNYEAVSIVATVTSKEHIEQIYTEIGGIEDVRYIL